MRVAVCDFPSRYPFPPSGYGGIERWLYAVARGVEACGWELALVGPQWTPAAVANRRQIAQRLEDSRLDDFGDGFDVIVAGHEYLDDPRWLRIARALSPKLVTFQHALRGYGPGAAVSPPAARLFCYSAEMVDRFRRHDPRQALAPGADLIDHVNGHSGGFLLWLGRIDPDKAPHVAARAATAARRRLVIAGPLHDPAYWAARRSDWDTPWVEYAGEVAGSRLAWLLEHADGAVYTRDAAYIEPGALVFSDFARAGLTTTALTYNGRDCASAVVDAHPELGTLVRMAPSCDEATAAAGLAEALAVARRPDRRRVREVGWTAFSYGAHAEALVRG